MPFKFPQKVKIAQQTGIINDFAEATNWEPLVYDPAGTGERIPNPVTREAWLNKKIDEYVKSVVRDYRLNLARRNAEAAVISELSQLED